MRFVHTLSLVLAFGLATPCASAPSIPSNPHNLLAAYALAPVPSFALTVYTPLKPLGLHGAVPHLTPHTWYTPPDTPTLL